MAVAQACRDLEIAKSVRRRWIRGPEAESRHAFHGHGQVNPCRQRHRIELAFGRLKDWRRIATRYDRCATIFFGAVTFATIVIFWLGNDS